MVTSIRIEIENVTGCVLWLKLIMRSWGRLVNIGILVSIFPVGILDEINVKCL